MSSRQEKPADAQYNAFGSHYKIGGHGYLYRWSTDQWLRSTNNINQVINEHKFNKNITSGTSKKQLIVNIKNYLKKGNTINNTAEFFSVSRYRVKKIAERV